MAKLPEIGAAPEFYDGWRQNFALRRIGPEAAEQASVLLLATKHYPKDHLDTLVKLALEAKYGAYPARAEEAAAKSQDCPHCFGEGRAHVADRESRAGFAIPCICELGRLRLSQDKRDARPGQIVIDLAEILAGKTYDAVLNGRTVTLDFREET